MIAVSCSKISSAKQLISNDQWKKRYYWMLCILINILILKKEQPTYLFTSLLAICQDSKISSGNVFKMPKKQLFCKSKQCLTKTLFRHLKKTSQRHLQTVKTTYEDAFKIFKRQLLCKSNHCLSKPLFRQLVTTSVNCLGRISKTNQYGIFLANLAPFNWPWYLDLSHTYIKMCICIRV